MINCLYLLTSPYIQGEGKLPRMEGKMVRGEGNFEIFGGISPPPLGAAPDISF